MLDVNRIDAIKPWRDICITTRAMRPAPHIGLLGETVF